MASETTNRRHNPCQNVPYGCEAQCGCTIYRATYSETRTGMLPLWECCNCHAQTSRKTLHRPTNEVRGWHMAKALREKWAPVDAEIMAMVEAGVCKGGAVLVYGSTWNYHVEILSGNKGDKKLTARDIKYHTSQALADLAKAQEWVNKTKGEAA